MAVFGLSLGPVVWLYIPEIVQPKIVPYSTMANWMATLLIVFLFPVIRAMLPDKNPAILFLFFSVWCLCSFFFNAKFVIETKGKSEK
jgi:Na+/melibiose symporter-like transporter